jgi:hypothetical protein
VRPLARKCSPSRSELGRSDALAGNSRPVELLVSGHGSQATQEVNRRSRERAHASSSHRSVEQTLM